MVNSSVLKPAVTTKTLKFYFHLTPANLIFFTRVPLFYYEASIKYNTHIRSVNSTIKPTVFYFPFTRTVTSCDILFMHYARFTQFLIVSGTDKVFSFYWNCFHTCVYLRKGTFLDGDLI